MSKKPTYGEAILWLIANERLDWFEPGSEATVPDTVWVISDLFGVSTLQILKDVRATLESGK